MLVWIDLEMSGLDPDHDQILEIACIVTDSHFHAKDDGLNIVIHQEDDVLKNMNDWCQKQHAKTGLTQAVATSDVMMAQAEELILEYIKFHCRYQESPICGNSICTDRQFIRKQMPRIHEYLHYRQLDVSSFKIIANQHYPHLSYLKSGNQHRALDDIRSSIDEMRYYMQHMLIPKGAH